MSIRIHMILSMYIRTYYVHRMYRSRHQKQTPALQCMHSITIIDIANAEGLCHWGRTLSLIAVYGPTLQLTLDPSTPSNILNRNQRSKQGPNDWDEVKAWGKVQGHRWGWVNFFLPPPRSYYKLGDTVSICWASRMCDCRSTLDQLCMWWSHTLHCTCVCGVTCTLQYIRAASGWLVSVFWSYCWYSHSPVIPIRHKDRWKKMKHCEEIHQMMVWYARKCLLL